MCMTLTNFYLPLEEQYNTDITLLHPGVFVVGIKPSIHHNFFNNSSGYPYINDNPIYNTQMFHPVTLKSSKRIKNDNKSDDTSNNGTTVQPLPNTWVSDEVSYSIINNNNNFNSNNINNNINDNNILTSNESSER